MAKQPNPTNIAGARKVAGVAQTDRGVIHPSNDPGQARKDAQQSGVFERAMAHLNRVAEQGQK